MKQIRMRLILLVIALVLSALILTLTTQGRARFPWWAYVGLTIVTFAIVKAFTGGFTSSELLPLVITEACALAITSVLTYWVGMAISDFEASVEKISIGHPVRQIEPGLSGEGAVYREVRRARNHQRSLSLLAIEVDDKITKTAQDKIIQEAQESLMRQLVLSRVSKILCEKLEDCDILVRSNDHFLVVAPETTPQNLPWLVERLRQQVADEIGIDLLIGTASLPDDGYTFDGLLDKATRGMRDGLTFDQFLEFELQSIRDQATKA
jgi:GGDEF domain-containing protein